MLLRSAYWEEGGGRRKWPVLKGEGTGEQEGGIGRKG